MSHPTPAVANEAPPPVRVERRAAPRHPSAHLTVCRAVYAERGDTWTALVENVSTVGVALLMLRSFEPGTALAIQAPPGGPVLPPLPFARVVRSQEHAKDLWLVGCQFFTELSEEQLQSLR